MTKETLDSDEAELAAYNERWATVEREFFKLETLQRYADEYSPGFREYEKGQLTDDQLVARLRQEMSQGPDPWYERVKAGAVSFKRVHLVDLPLSPYLWYEIKSYELSRELGEQIFILARDKAQGLGGVPLEDLMMFDDSSVLVQHYDAETGKWLYTDLFEGAEEVRPYVVLRDELLHRAESLEEFMARQSEPAT